MSRRRGRKQRDEKREAISRRKSQARRAAPDGSSRAAKWIVVLVAVCVVGTGAFWGLRGGGGGSRFARPAVTPARRDTLDQNLIDLIDRQIAVVNSDPGNANGHATLGMIYTANGLAREARESFENAARIAPDNPAWRLHAAAGRRAMGDADGVLEEFRRLAAAFPGHAPIQYRLGDALLEADELDAAAVAMERAIALKPLSPEPYVGLGEVRLRKRNYATAAELLEKARDLDPTYRMTNYLLGQAYRGLGRREDAARELALGVDTKKRFMPDEVTTTAGRYLVGLSAQLSQSSALMEAGRFDQAAVVLAKTLAANPNNTDVMNNLAVAYLKTQRFADALDILLRAERMDDTSFPTYINIVECLLALERPAEAVPYGDRAVELAPRIGQARFAQARALLGAKRLAEARDALAATLQVDTRNPEAYLLLGEVCAALGLDAEAKAHFAAAAKRMPRVLRAHLGLTAVCIRLGLYEEAAAALDPARRLAPQNPGVTAMADRIAARGR